ncbi:aromatic-ring-hydroxylating dioxygenase subunit beta [Sphingorhabdus sp.]|jgi:salicylate 5-hydroxylase small subunit|uniref:aromatic-ring-hydroxylating dioxygenase subunit beta n=1 Tax=Sphingorhabdus sp. TaxID=1902408 RepID=UPI0037CC362D
MTMTEPSFNEIISLYARYAASIDEERFDDWVGFFTDNCVYRVIPRENHDAGRPLASMSLKGVAGLRDRIYGVTSTVFHAPYYQRHIIGLPLVKSQDGDLLSVEANYLVLRTKRDHLTEVYNAGRYIDTIQVGSDGLKFQEKLCVFDSELIPNSLIYPI